MLVINGKIIDPSSNESYYLNRSFKYGDGLFEAFRIYQGRILFVDDHLNRLIAGMEALKFSFDENEFREEVKKQMETLKVLNGVSNHGRIRLHVYRTGPGSYTPLDLTPSYLIEAYSLKNDYFASEASIFAHPLSGSSFELFIAFFFQNGKFSALYPGWSIC